MATNIDEGASGELKPYYRFYESASGHKETSSSATLKANDEKTLLLEINSGSFDQLHSPGNKDITTQYKITVSDLIELIKKNGDKA